MKANIEVTAQLGNYKIVAIVDIGSDETIKEQIMEALQDENPELEEDEQVSEDQINYEVTSWLDLADYSSLQDADILEELADLDQDDLEMVNAAVYCGISIDNIDEAYSGKFYSDEKFAEDLADQLGYIKDTPQWPYTCIDWTQAAKELMYDYCEQDGYYFRNL